MPHNPSTCPRCRWLAEREGVWSYFTQGKRLYHTSHGIIEDHPSYCTSLDAVAGLRQEMNEYSVEKQLDYYWNHSWWPSSKIWVYEAPGSGYERRKSAKDLPAACVIKAAMQVLGNKE